VNRPLVGRNIATNHSETSIIGGSPSIRTLISTSRFHKSVYSFQRKNYQSTAFNEKTKMLSSTLSSVSSSDVITPEDSASSVAPVSSAAPVSSVAPTGRLAALRASIIDAYNDQFVCWSRVAFEKSDDSKQWICLLCSKPYTVSANTTANIRKHLEKRHSHLADALKQKQLTMKASSETGIRQTSLDKKAKIVEFSPEGLKKHLVKYCVLTDQSFLNVEHPVFTELLEFLRPNINLPSRKTLRNLVLVSFREKQMELKELLKEVY
jgi:hypothetical protein